MRPLAIDLFAGAGGLSLGFEQAGFDVVAAADVDPIHCATHKFNFPGTAILPNSVSGMTADEIRKVAEIGCRAVDCVFGGPPCQGFSLIGHRALEDPRNALVLEFVRIVSELGARTFMFENVKGLTVGQHKAFLYELVQAFDDAGYNVRLPWRVLDAGYYGVPQHRERLILFGSKKGTRLPDYPVERTNPADASRLLPRLPTGPTCEEALQDLPDADRFDALIDGDSVHTTAFGKPSPYAKELRCLAGNKSWYYGYPRKWDSEVLTSSARTSHTEISRRRFTETQAGEVERISRFFNSPNGLSNTLRAGTDGARGAFTSPRPIHFAYPRCITVREMARLHGFPDWFRFHITKWHGARQIGNSVPPPLARALAGSIIAALGIEPARPEEILELGSPMLLNMNISEAARFFGVTPPSGRRDRKSGAKKRKQHEIEEERGGIRAINA